MLDWLQQLTPPENLAGPLVTAYVLLDVFLIILLARILGGLLVKIKQPRVVGEILAGILLGPTLLGKTLSLVVAPAQARPVLGAIAAMGLILFMFLAGVEFDASKVKGREKQAGLLALLSIAVPALLGFPVGQLMYNDTYVVSGTPLTAVALFIGAALSVTAFPVMAHILMERGELNTPMGSLGVATTGIMSVLMFTYIAFAGAVASGSGFNGLLTQIGLMIVFGVVSWFVVRPFLARTFNDRDGKITGNGMGIIFGGMILYGLIADRIGINALVGGFVWGMLLPTNPALRKAIASKVSDVALIFLLPVFFAMAGFSADLKLLTPQTLPIVLVVLLAAIGGKFIAAAPAKAFGLSWNEVGILGSLFNTRGLLVLVVGLIGLQLQIITDLTFTITVVVALVTNLMTLPLLSIFSRPQPQAQPAPVAAAVSGGGRKGKRSK